MTATPPTSIMHFGICVTDAKRSLDFYIQALGLEFVRSIDELGAPFDTLTELPGAKFSTHHVKCGGIMIELICFLNQPTLGTTERKPMNQLGLTHFTLVINDLDTVTRKVEQFGGKVIEASRVDSDFGRIVFCTDPDGVRIELLEMIAQG